MSEKVETGTEYLAANERITAIPVSFDTLAIEIKQAIVNRMANRALELENEAKAALKTAFPHIRAFVDVSISGLSPAGQMITRTIFYDRKDAAGNIMVEYAFTTPYKVRAIIDGVAQELSLGSQFIGVAHYAPPLN